MRMDMAPVKVWIAERMARDPLDLMVQAGLEVKDASKLDRQALLAEIHEAQVLVVRSQTRVDRELLDRARSLKLVGRAGTGVDTIDVAYARSKGILVVNAPGANAVSVAEHAFGHILAVARRIGEGTVGLRQGLWQKKSLTGIELFGKVLGLVGFGRIGKEVSSRAKAFGMRVIAFDPLIPGESIRDMGAEPVGFESLCRQADVISLHLPANKETHNLFGREVLASLKRGVILINCARGGLIDEAALEEALNSNQVFGVGLDVFADEPSPRPSLVGHPRVVCTPHIAASTPEAETRAGLMVAEEVIAWSKGNPLRYTV